MSYGEGQMTGFGFMRIIPVSCCLGKPGHEAAACMSNVLCDFCGEKGHSEEHCLEKEVEM